MLQEKKKNKVVHKAMRNVTKSGCNGAPPRALTPGSTPVVTHTLTFDTSIAYV